MDKATKLNKSISPPRHTWKAEKSLKCAEQLCHRGHVSTLTQSPTLTRTYTFTCIEEDGRWMNSRIYWEIKCHNINGVVLRVPEECCEDSEWNQRRGFSCGHQWSEIFHHMWPLLQCQWLQLGLPNTPAPSPSRNEATFPSTMTDSIILWTLTCFCSSLSLYSSLNLSGIYSTKMYMYI